MTDQTAEVPVWRTEYSPEYAPLPFFRGPTGELLSPMGASSRMTTLEQARRAAEAERESQAGQKAVLLRELRAVMAELAFMMHPQLLRDGYDGAEANRAPSCFN